MAHTIHIPLRIEVQIGEEATSPAIGMNSVGNPATEAARQPIIDTNYGNRQGFNPSFIGLSTPLPTVRTPGILAPRLDGNGSLLPYEHFTIAMHAQRRLALFTAANVDYSPAAKEPEPGRNYTRKALNGFSNNVRGEIWLLDSRIAAHHQVENRFYDRDNGAFQKGHVVRREDVCFGSSYDQVRRANGDTFHSTNCSPQRPDFNDAGQSGIWGELENFIARQANTEKLNMFAGPVLADDDPIFDGQGNSGPLPLRIPVKFWKIVCANDRGRLKVFAFLLEQDLDSIPTREFAVNALWRRKMISLADLEALVPLRFDATMHQADQHVGETSRVGRGSSAVRVPAEPAGNAGIAGGGLRSVGRNSGGGPGRTESAGGGGLTQRGVYIPGRQPRGGTAESVAAVRDPRLAVGKAGARKTGTTETAASSAVETVLGNDQRNRVTATSQPPWRMICSLTMDSPNGRFIGTGWIVGRKTIITAGHCVYDPSPDGMGGWADSIRVTPGRDGSNHPFGSQVSTRFFTNNVWLNSQTADFDYGCIQLDTPIAEDLGSFAVLSPSAEDLLDYFVNIAGYPGDRGDGQQLFHHRNHVLRVTDRRIYYDVDTYGGQSGAPVFIYETDGGPPMVVGIHAYGVGGTPAALNIEANSSPRITPEVAELIRGWINDNP